MSAIAHNDPHNYCVGELTEPRHYGGYGGAGWYVVRKCRCHDGLPVSGCFADQAGAERCLAAIAEDWRRYGRDVA